MPVSIGQIIPEPEEPIADLVADVRTDVPLDFVPLFSMEQAFGFPTNFAELPKAEQDAIIAKYRFQGIRCRHDITDRTIPRSRETMDLP